MKTALFDTLSLLSEPIRVRLVHVLSAQELGVGEVALVLQTPQSTVSRHLKQLLNQGWVERRSVGPASYLSVADPLPREASRLWQVIADELASSGIYEEDLRRAQTVVAQREVDSAAFFGKHAQGWAALRRELFGTNYLLPTLTALLSPSLTVADLGCGTGEVLACLSPVVERVIGVDQEQAMLAAAHERTADLHNVSLVRSPLQDLDLPSDSVDVALCMLVLHHVREPGPVLAELARILRPGGRAVLLDMVEHDRTGYRRTMGHVHLGFSQATMGAWVEDAGLTLRSWRRLPPDPAAQGPELFLAVLTP